MNIRLKTGFAQLCLACLIASVCHAENGGVKPATMEKYQKAKQQVEELAKGSASKYAPEIVTAAHASIDLAQNGLKAGSENQTMEAVEMANLQVKLAGALTEERVAAEKSEAAKRELLAFEKRLEAILAGKGDTP
jgi:hypothetical protein